MKIDNSLCVFVLAIVLVVLIIIVNVATDGFTSTVETDNCPEKLVTPDGKNFYFEKNGVVDTTAVFMNPMEASLHLKRKKCVTFNLPIEKKDFRKPVVKSSNDPTVSYDRLCNKEVSHGEYKDRVCMIDKLAKDTNTPYETMYNSIFQDGRGIIFPVLDMYTNKEPITDLMTDKVFGL